MVTVLAPQTKTARPALPVTPRLESAVRTGGVVNAGDRGVAVREAQQLLVAQGFNVGRAGIDGAFGPDTEAAVRAFQRSRGVRIDGKIGPETLRELRTPTAALDARQGPVGTGIVPDAATRVRGMSGADFARAAAAADVARANTGALSATTLRSGNKGAAVSALQTRLNAVSDAGLQVDGDFGGNTRRAVQSFQRRAGLDDDGIVGPQTRRALDEVAAGTRTLGPDNAPAPAPDGPARPNGPGSRSVTVDGNTFRVHDQTRAQFGRTSVPGNRIIAMDSNSATGREEILRPLIVIPNNATAAERRAAQAAVDRVARWLADNNPGEGRATTGILKTTAQNGRGIGGFFHTEFHSVNDSGAVNLIKQRPEEYARLLGSTLGSIPGANFIVPHGVGSDVGAVSADGRTTEISLARHVVQDGFGRL